MALISSFDPWKSKLCTCPEKFSLSPYTGCSHGCLYCYASSYISRFYQPRLKKDFLPRLQKELKKLPPGSYLTIANSSDPYQPLEKTEKLTRNFLKIISETTSHSLSLRIMIVTKSDLVLEDLDLLSKTKNTVIAVSITTLRKNLARKIEPRAPEPQKRIRAISELAKKLPVVLRFDPMIYPLNTEEIEEIVQCAKEVGVKQVITSTFKARRDSLKRIARAFPEFDKLWQELYLKKGEEYNRYYYLPVSLRKELIEKVREAALKEKLAFSSCREGFNQLNTALCDGSAWF